jgi:sulfur-carrier protein
MVRHACGNTVAPWCVGLDLFGFLRQIRSMAKVIFTSNLRRHVDCPASEAEGRTVREVLERIFAVNDRARGYVLDDQSALRKHMTIIVDGACVKDRVHLSDPVTAASEIYVFQALSGG